MSEIEFNRCTYMCPKKQQKCKLLAKKDLIYCGEHMIHFHSDNNDTPTIARVQCPLDPKHSVILKNLDKHLKKCNSRERFLGPFDVKDINSFESDEDSNEREDLKDFKIQNLSEGELNDTIDFLLKLDTRLNLSQELVEIHDTDFYVNGQMNEHTGTLPQKHLKQISSLVANIKKVYGEKSKKKTLFIEMGAGRGKLSHWLSKSLDNKEQETLSQEEKKFLLIELGSQRYKFDNYHRDEFKRLRMNIKNLCLNKIDQVQECESCIIYGKHLCGSATDYTLKCLKRTLSVTSDAHKFTGLLLALCCHHRCEWSSFAGRKYFRQELKLNNEWFYRIRSLTSWATCGQRVNENDFNDELKLKRDKIGRIAKNLLDTARIKYLTQGINSNVKLFTYCDQDVTLENRLLIVLPPLK